MSNRASLSVAHIDATPILSDGLHCSKEQTYLAIVVVTQLKLMGTHDAVAVLVSHKLL